MRAVVPWLDLGALRMVGWTLVHSLWIAALLAAALWLALRLIPPALLRTRYCLAMGFLTILVLGSGAVGGLLLADWSTHRRCWRLVEQPAVPLASIPRHCVDHAGPALRARAVREGASGEVEPGAWSDPRDALASHAERLLVAVSEKIRLRSLIRRIAIPSVPLSRPLHVIAVVCMVLTAALLMRFLGAVVTLRRLVRRAEPCREPMLRELVRSLSTTAPLVEVRTTAEIEAPALVGWLEPVILLPLGFARSLPRDQLAAILAHELIHARRRDYLVNLLQEIVDVVFFFNPFAAWISGRIREEREAVCDREVIERGNVQLRSYVHALLAAERRRGPPAVGTAPVISHGHRKLLGRVRRLAVRTELAGRFPRTFTAVTGLTGFICLSAAATLLAYEAASLSSFGVMALDVERRYATSELLGRPVTDGALPSR